MTEKRIVYYASELSSCVGMNRFTEPWQAAVKIFQRVSPTDYLTTVSKLPTYKQELTPRQTETLLAEKGCLDSVKGAVDCPQVELETRLENVFRDSVLKEDEKEVNDLVKKYVYTSRGNLAEGPALDGFEQSRGCQMVERNSRFRVTTLKLGQRSVLLGGKVDGVTDGGELVEVKNRQRRMLNFVPVHERVQVHAYMALTGKNSCTLIQTCGDLSRSTTVEWDDGLWDRVCKELLPFHEKLEALLQSPERQLALLGNQQL
jgi:hypothetical protein